MFGVRTVLSVSGCCAAWIASVITLLQQIVVVTGAHCALFDPFSVQAGYSLVAVKADHIWGSGRSSKGGVERKASFTGILSCASVR